MNRVVNAPVVETAPQIDAADYDNDNLCHVCCCNQDVALCGADVSDVTEWGDPFLDEPDDCVVCVELKGGTCGAPFCGVRLWWRWTRFGRIGRGTPP